MSASIVVENPSTGQPAGEVDNLDAAAVAAAAKRARAAQPGWAALGFGGRARYLRRMQKWFVDNVDRVARTIHDENGKSFDEAHIEVTYAAMACAFWARTASRYLADQRVRTRSPLLIGRKLVTRYEPVGLVGVIGPWNNPVLNNFGDVVPALAAGNAVLHKPSEITPLSALLTAEMALDIDLPEGVFQVLTGDGQTGAALVDQVDVVMFTGSTRTGRAVAMRCAERLIPCSLELGGKDPVIVLRDADLDRAVNLTVFAAMHNTGQTCTSAERVYVEAPIYDEFVARITDAFDQLRQGESTGLGTSDAGSMTFPPQIDTVSRHVDEAVAAGARTVVGGHRRPGPARFFEPTVLVDVDHSMACMREETFGPTLPIMKVADAEEAIRLANDSSYGLQASIFTKDQRRGEQLARQIEAGVVTVNDALANYFALELPMGGWKESGLGVRHGPDGIRKYARRQSILITRFPLKSELHAMPFKARNFRLIKALVRVLYGHPRGTH